jgi:DNA primase
MKISPEKIAQIRSLNPIEEIIGSYIALKKAGKSYKALCPFHSEKAPSFFVSPDKGVYHCFGCGKSGNVFTFLMEYNNLNYYEAVKFLADRVGIQIKLSRDENEELYRGAEFVASLYHSVLLSEKGLPGRKWLEMRGILQPTIEKFMLGYAPLDPIIWEKARLSGISKEALESIGVLKDNNDVFRKKIIFPIKNRWGRVVGFGTRVLDETLPKYINSKESPIFKKGNLLYGFYAARRELKEKAIIVEGYMDLLTLSQAGIKNVVASLGTSFTQEQAKFLKLYTQEVIILYDGDSAGRRACERAIDVLLAANIDVNILPLPPGEDPDSFVKKRGKLDFTEIQDFVEFKFKQHEDRETLIRSFQETLNKIPDPIKREVLTEKVARKLDIRKELLFVEKTIPLVTKPSVEKSIEELEAELLGIAVSHADARKVVIENMAEIKAQDLKDALSLVIKGADAGEVIDLLPNERLKYRFTKPSFWEETNYEKLANDYLNRIKEERKKIERKEIREKSPEEWGREDLIKYYDLIKQKRK